MNLAVFKKIVIEIPLLQICILMGLCTLAAFLGRLKLVLIMVYGAALYWVFILNEAKFGFSNEASLLHTALFIISALVFVACSAWVYFIER